MFYIAIPPSSIVTCRTNGSTSTISDADMYVKFGSEPVTLSSYDATSLSISANEKEGPLSPSTSRHILYIVVYAYTAFTNVMLWCNLEYASQQLAPGET